MNVPDLKTFKLSALNDAVIRKYYPEFYQYLTDNYPCDLTVSQKMYWYFNGLTDYPKCPMCGKRTKYRNINYGYSEYCSTQCANASPEHAKKIQEGLIKNYGSKENAYKAIREKVNQTNLKRYGVENTTQVPKIKEKIFSTIKERYGGIGFASKELNEKQKQKMVDLYGVENSMQSDKIIEKVKKNNLDKYGTEWHITSKEVKQKIKNTCLKKYGVEHYNNPEKIKNTMFERYGVTGNFARKDVQQKMIDTCIQKYSTSDDDLSNITNVMNIKGVIDKVFSVRRENGTLSSSTAEKLFEKYLIDNNYEFKKQYKCERYPFRCDFYITKYDLFIEIQGMWTHGGHPYDKNSEADNKLLEYWKSKKSKFYDAAVGTWSIGDVNKRKTAKENNLNYLEVFSIDVKDVIQQFEEYISKL